jgi:hypothetical protein
LIGLLWTLVLPFAALLARLDWGLLVILWIVSISAFFLAVRLSGVEPQEAEAIRACLVEMERKGRPPAWSMTLNSFMARLLVFPGVAAVAALFPAIAWYWWLLLGMFLGSRLPYCWL